MTEVGGETGAAGGAPPPSSWRDTLDEPSRMGISKFKTDVDLASGYLALEKKLGDPVRVPRADAPDEEWTKYFSSMAPSKPEEYGVEFPTHEGRVNWNGADTLLPALAHKYGLHPKQLNGIINEYAATLRDQSLEHDKVAEAEIDKLKSEYGAKYEPAVEMANRALKQLGGDELLAFAKEGAGTDPRFIRFALKLGSLVSEDNVIGDSPAGGVGPSDARAKINAIKADKKGAYYDRDNPGHWDAVDEVTKLYEVLARADEK